MVGSERNTRMRKLSATILFIVFVLAVQGYAQSITGSLNGRVVDQQGSAVPNAKVTSDLNAKTIRDDIVHRVRACGSGVRAEYHGLAERTCSRSAGQCGSERQGYCYRGNQETDGRHEYNRRGRFLDRRIGAGQLQHRSGGVGI